jgi:hypothetical protein
MTSAQAAAMEGTVAILLLLLVWRDIFLHIGKFDDLVKEENGQNTHRYFIIFLTLSIVWPISSIICFRLQIIFTILTEFLIVTSLVLYWLT